MKPETIELVRSSWRKAEPVAPQVSALFYENLFAADPATRAMFKGDMTQQGDKLMRMIGTAVGKLHETQVLIPVLESLARRHVEYGVKDEHYATVGAALLKTLEGSLGPDFTPEVADAWAEVYGVMSGVMIAAART